VTIAGRRGQVLHARQLILKVATDAATFAPVVSEKSSVHNLPPHRQFCYPLAA